MRNLPFHLPSGIRESGVGWWQWEQRTGVLTTSENLCSVLGLPKGTTIATLASRFALVHPADNEHHRRIVEAAAGRLEGWHCRFRIVRPLDQRVVMLEETALVKPDPTSDDVIIIGFIWECALPTNNFSRLAEVPHDVRFGGVSLRENRHICAFFSSTDDEYDALANFVSEGVQKGQPVIQIFDASDIPGYKNRVTELGLDIDTCINCGQVHLETWDNTYLSNGRFDADRVLTLIDSYISANRKDNSVVRMTGWVDWMGTEWPGSEQFFSYESRLNEVLSNSNAVAVCLYRIEKTPPALLLTAFQTHPIVFIGGIMYENVFFDQLNKGGHEAKASKSLPMADREAFVLSKLLAITPLWAVRPISEMANALLDILVDVFPVIYLKLERSPLFIEISRTGESSTIDDFEVNAFLSHNPTNDVVLTVLSGTSVEGRKIVGAAIGLAGEKGRLVALSTLDYFPSPRQRMILRLSANMIVTAMERLANTSTTQRQQHIRNLIHSLTAREKQVMDLVVQGQTNKKIAQALGIAEITVKVHRRRVMDKLSARSVPDLTRIALSQGKPVGA